MGAGILPQAGEEALPRGRVLSYVTNVSTPTRVRLEAAWWVFMLGVLYMNLFALLFVYLVYDALSELVIWPYFFLPISFEGWVDVSDIVRAVEQCLTDEPWLGVMLILSCVQWLPYMLLAQAIKRGSRVASRMAGVAVSVHLVCVVLAMTLAAALIVVDATGFVSGPHDYSELWWLLAAAPVLVVIMLLKDVVGFLFWIARNPIAEKQPVAFLPGRKV